VTKAKEAPEIKEDEEMVEKAEKIVEKLDSFANQKINEEVLITVMKTQELVKEIYSNANSN